MENEQFVHQLRAAAILETGREQDAAVVERATSEKLSGSRAALLYINDRLARNSFNVLAAVAIAVLSVTGFILLSPGGTAPLLPRLPVWLLVTGTSFAWAASLAIRYRQGTAFQIRPFSWQQAWTCQLAVLGTAFGSGIIMLTPPGLSADFSLVLSAVFVLTGTILALILSPFRVAAFSFTAPVFLAVIGDHLASLASAPGSALPLHLAVTVAIALTGGCISALVLTRSQAAESAALAKRPRHVMQQISARNKPRRQGYNPYAMRRKANAENPAPANLDDPFYRPSEL